MQMAHKLLKSESWLAKDALFAPQARIDLSERPLGAQTLHEVLYTLALKRRTQITVMSASVPWIHDASKSDPA